MLPRPSFALQPWKSTSSLDCRYESLWRTVSYRLFSTCWRQAEDRHWARWTPDEDALIVQHREEGLTCSQIAQHMPGRSARSIQTRTYSLRNQGVPNVRGRYNLWTAEEKAALHQAQESGMTAAQAKLYIPSRTYASIASMLLAARRRGGADQQAFKDTYPRRGPTWTAAEDAEMLHLRQEKQLSWSDVAKRIPGRSVMSLKARYRFTVPVGERKQLPHRNALSDADRKELRELVEAGNSVPQIASAIGRSRATIRHYKKTMALEAEFTDARRNANWTPKLDAELLSLRKAGMTMLDIARAMQRTYPAVCGRHRVLVHDKKDQSAPATTS